MGPDGRLRPVFAGGHAVVRGARRRASRAAAVARGCRYRPLPAAVAVRPSSALPIAANTSSFPAMP